MGGHAEVQSGQWSMGVAETRLESARLLGLSAFPLYDWRDTERLVLLCLLRCDTTRYSVEFRCFQIKSSFRSAFLLRGTSVRIS